MKFQEFKVGQTFKSRVLIDNDDFQKYISFAKTKNILHEKPELAAKEGIKGTLLPGRAIIARAEGEMTRLDIFSDSIMLLYGMDGDPNWDNRHTRFMGEVYAGDELEVEYSISNKVEGNSERYGILSIDLQMGERADEFLQVLKKIWSDDVVEFKGKYYNIPASKINPKPIQKPIPVYLGGFTPNTFSRIIKYDLNGWLGVVEALWNTLKIV